MVFASTLIGAALLPFLKIPTSEQRGWLYFMWVVDLFLLSYLNKHNGDSGDGVVNYYFFANLFLEVMLVATSILIFDFFSKFSRR
ncbi:hypothetical protein DC3_18860 [Deinococcus cellulosilyticus NBRC 106333 = KACC 11606]|uniref:Uncharacterized protein n=2 Tax=Deinococcus cellulosilyticus TaxID=401558 RepID=A0A511N1C7_DEIC1|nr:hypothetical protein DC3_18860 [Deinococcus cellulosilyticus NBRC 106333 = KACC 11606]